LPCLLALVAIVSAFSAGHIALADAAPIELVLLYTPNVSNTGTTKASGIAELVMSEGEVRINATDLPRLDGDKRYVAWLLNSTTNEFQRVGAFNTAESTGAVQYENVLDDAIPDKGWNMLLITVEGSADADSPSNHHSIAGIFPNADEATLPGLLPNTGGDPDEPYQMADANRPNWLEVAGLAALALVGGGGAGYALGIKRR
jgi:hypothetical protein